MNEIVEKARCLFLDRRVKVTQINAEKDTSRFEARIERVEESDDEGFIELYLNKNVPVEYGLLKKRIIHYCHATKTYRGILVDKKQKHHIFMVELVGVRYLDHCEPLEEFGISIAGLDVRVIMFDVLFRNNKRPPVYGPHGKKVTEIFGDELCEVATEFLNDKKIKLTAEERYVIEKYLYGRNDKDGGFHA